MSTSSFPSPLRPAARAGLACFLLGLLLAWTGCDSGGGGLPPSELEGSYVFEQYAFIVSGVDDFNVLQDTLVAGPEMPRLEFFGGNARVNLVYKLEGNEARSVITGSFSTSEGRVTVDFSEVDQDQRFQLLLPPVVQFRLFSGRDTLRATQSVESVNLREYAPGRYGGLTQPVNGTLRLLAIRLGDTTTTALNP